ncbi:hypothetical protein BB559_001578 [Furculomyces boomerangus]|uniref:3-hydroxyisobutyryl-CoA hydrolase n=1 Tax=Furculomyces boomerangus TaxID=61424 RepID=A0A2T9Z1G9_9FUNG|nr:hypothetical protein BB559_001578 [Furculomyces boomerangus]
MLAVMGKKLQEWDNSKDCNNIIVKSSTKKSFCAGGDVVQTVKGQEHGTLGSILFFVREYEINHIFATTKKPVVAIIEGITMGGGVGASMHFPFRVATENTLLAMPETQIGLFPDVGASFFLSRIGSELGAYLGLTGTRLKGADVLYSGFATHLVNSKDISALEIKLQQAKTSSYEETNAILEQFSQKTDDYKNNYPYSLSKYLDAINRCFCYNTVGEILHALEREQEEKVWAKDTLKTLNSMSPSSLAVTLELIRRGKSMSIKQCLDMEGQVASKIITTNDYIQGVTELLITKTKNPKFDPPTVDKLDLGFIKKKYFEDYDERFRLEFKNSIDYHEYPHGEYTLPSETSIVEHVSKLGQTLSNEQIVERFDKMYNGKIGIKEKVWNVLQRTRKHHQKNLLSKL